MYSSVTSVSTKTDETAGTNATHEEARVSASSAESGGGRVSRGTNDGRGPRGPVASADPGRDGGDERAADRGSTVRTRLVESTVVAAITGVFIVLSGSTQIAPDLSLPVALAGVLWLFVRTLQPTRQGSGGSDSPDDGAASVGDATPTAAGAAATPIPDPDETPISTDRRLKMEVANHGGRMMQKDLVEAVDLSESAVSRRLSRLEREDDEVGRVCLGRENMVYLEGHRPHGAGSPFAGDADDRT